MDSWSNMEHQSVLLTETITMLDVKKDGIYVDCTLGRGGHSAEILKQCPYGHLYGLDRDKQALEESQARLSRIGDNFTCIHTDFGHMRAALESYGVNKADGILMDLGVSSPQFDDPARGFSYRYDARLDMRMDQTQELDAWTIVNTYSQEQLFRIFRDYGQDPHAYGIAKAIVKNRQEKSIDTTFELVEAIKEALPAKVINKKGHPAKKSFQAIRIEVNSELQELQDALQQALDLLDIKGRLCVISFHSLEDRIVKDAFNQAGKPPKVNKRLPVLEQEQLCFKLVTRKPITAGEEELNENNRSHSAKLRIIEKVREPSWQKQD